MIPIQYVVYAASVLAANAVLRSLLGAAFPLFTTDMYHNLGIHWASTIPAFLSLACVPFPFLFYKYGAKIRSKCKFAAEAAQVLAEIRAMQEGGMPTEAADTASVLPSAEKEAKQVDTLAVNSDSDSVLSPPPPAAAQEGVVAPK